MKMILLALAASAIASTASAQNNWRSETLADPMTDTQIRRVFLYSNELMPADLGDADGPLIIIFTNTATDLTLTLETRPTGGFTFQCLGSESIRVRFDDEPPSYWPCDALKSRKQALWLNNAPAFLERAQTAGRILIQGRYSGIEPTVMSFTTGR